MSVAEFSKEPLTEVVFGVEFNAPDFSSVHFGLYWQTIRDKFPNQPLDRPPIGEPELFNILPKLRRVWFESEDQKQLIQLQSNRFHYNWRRKSETESYPHYEEIYPHFIEEWNQFKSWWLKTEEKPLQPTRYELTYLNQINEYFDWNSPSDYSKIFTIGKALNNLPLSLSSTNVNLEFSLANNQGRLIVSLGQGINPKDNKPAVILNLTASHNDTRVDIEQWFDMAHQSIVEMFLSLINPDIKEAWGFKWLKH